MKTKLTLFVAVLAVALFGIGCSSMGENELRQPVVHSSDVIINKEDSLYYATDSQVPFTGTIQGVIEGNGVGGTVTTEIQVKDGLLHGYYKLWDGKRSRTEPLMIFERGKLVFKKSWGRKMKLSNNGRFKLDGTPKIKVTDDNPRQPVVHSNEVTINKDNGLYYAKDSKEPFTGTIQEIHERDGAGGMMAREFQVEDGLLHGYHRGWDRHASGLGCLRKYDRGKQVFTQNWGRDGKVFLWGRFKLNGDPIVKVTDDNPRQTVVHLTSIEQKNGLYYLKGSKKLFTGTIQHIGEKDGTAGIIRREFQVQDGLLHGYDRGWDRHDFGLGVVTKYDRGKLVFKQAWERDREQIELEAFNIDGSPKSK